ncbi:MAG: fibronectin type III domain-containing protein, partial [Bdellovibrionaceae bacterium]|nr:fibronectin type III domain-containing protein [Pseudobdellovibrionaceae bacterium]
GLVGIISMAIAALFHVMNEEQRNIKARMEMATALQMAQGVLARTQDCSCQFQGKRFDSTSASSSVDIDRFKLNCLPGAPEVFRKTGVGGVSGPELIVDRISLSQIQATGNSEEFIGKFMVTPLTGSSSRIQRVIPLNVRFYTDPATPANSKRIVACGAVPISVPANLAAVAGDARCSLSWSESAGAKPIVYVVKTSTTPGGASTGGTVCSTPANNCLVTGLANDVDHYFSIQAVNQTEASAFATPEVICHPLQPVSAPTLMVSNTGTACNLSWARPAGSPTISYTVKHSAVAGGSATGVVVCSTTGYSCVHSGLPVNSTQFYSLMATNPVNSALSVEVACFVPSPTILVLPAIVTGPVGRRWGINTFLPPNNGRVNSTQAVFNFSASGGTGRYTYSIRILASHGEAISMNATTGVLTVTGDRNRNSSYEVTVSDGITRASQVINLNMWW